MKKIALVLAALSLVLFAACGGDDETETAGATDAPPPAESTDTPSEAPTEEESPSSDTGTSDVSEVIAGLETCLNESGIETKVEKADLPIYGEKATVGLTFEYPQITVPDAVTLWIYDSEEAAAKGKKAIDENLLEGDTETLLRGQVVVDDFGNTLDTPEAEEQAAFLDSCMV